ncbi:DNA helicase [Anaeramoeba flamelloides]|uniref:DNA replication licensing factor MCM2 n=1 Tax=Anaeramoeba flamelloides TaxID=1746091 RepID=A0AAV7Y0V2_9EUKA|nr:DNA helicase [Anaeramoeba flamelloides]
MSNNPKKRRTNQKKKTTSTGSTQTPIFGINSPIPTSPQFTKPKTQKNQIENENKKKEEKQEEKPFSEEEYDEFDELDEYNTPVIEEEGEDLFGDETLQKDYEYIAELDVYDPEMIDQNKYEQMSFGERRKAEKSLMLRDYRNRHNTKVKNIQNEQGTNLPRSMVTKRSIQTSKLKKAKEILEEDEEDDEEELEEFNLEDVKGPLKLWIKTNGPKMEIARRYRNFLTSFVDKRGNSVYAEKIKLMCSENQQSLEVSFTDLSLFGLLLAMWLADAPTEMLEIFKETTYQVVLEMFQDYHEIHSEIFVRIIDFPVPDTLRGLRQVHLNTLIKVSGVVTRRTSVFPQLKLVKFDCLTCGATLGPFAQNNQKEIKIDSCPFCSKRGPFRVNTEETVYQNYQKITLQESPGTVPAGRLPRTKDIILLADLIDIAKPGEEIEITGIYRNNFDLSLNTKNGFPVFATIIEANYVSKSQNSVKSITLTNEDINIIRELGEDPHISERIFLSIAPSIYGHETLKIGLAMTLFGGNPKNIGQKHKIRGDINMLLLGDPSTSKSQLLKYAEKIAPRAVYTTGKGATGVGLTASVRRDPITREWTLEGGALVLADRGICCIDEFDKMNEKDRVSIHETMEQQTISISKAGIVTTLQARCSVIAAANPIKGRYDLGLTFKQNVELSDPILSRFDILCVVRDVVDPIIDTRLANFVISSHMNNHPLKKQSLQDEQQQQEENEMNMEENTDSIESSSMYSENSFKKSNDEENLLLDNYQNDEFKKKLKPIPQDMLRKYIYYARNNIRPRLSQMDNERITKLYTQLRKESSVGGSMPITTRHVESLIRMAESHAKMHLRTEVRDDDINAAIRILLETFISTQKFSVMNQLRKRLRKYLNYKRDNDELLYYLLQTLVKESVDYLRIKDAIENPEKVEISTKEFRSRARELNLFEIPSFFKSNYFIKNNFSLEKGKKIIVKSFK